MLATIILVPLAALGFCIFLMYSTHSRLIALDERCTTSFSDIDVLLKHRHSLIPGILQTVRNYVGHEREIFNSVLEMHQLAIRSTSMSSRLKAENVLSQNVTNLMNIAQRVPELKAEKHFVHLRNAFTDVENRITASRRFYNNTVEEHNRTLRQFPGNIMGNMMRLSRRENFDLGVDRYFMDEPVSLAL